MTATAAIQPQPFVDDGAVSLDLFAELCRREVDSADYPLARAVRANVVLYAGDDLRAALGDSAAEAAFMREMGRCLRDGPGVFAIAGAYTDLDVIDRCTAAFAAIVAHERASGQGRGDHFGSNERIWNSLQKLAEYDPELFIDYYGNPLLGLACRAWLGPSYQLTAQMNNVKPGGKAQSAHRDYHLGFQAPATVAAFPEHAQVMSQFLTLQGAIAHCDMPVEKGPTLLLPFSQLYALGYMAFERPEFVAYFDAHRVQLPLAKGDMLFFNPALFHAGGHNRTDSDRVVNLVQVSSAFGRTMETINHHAMIAAVYPALQRRLAAGAVAPRHVADTVAAMADGYAFPTNLDSDPPIGGNAPATQQDMVRQALAEGWSVERLDETLNAYATRRRA